MAKPSEVRNWIPKDIKKGAFTNYAKSQGLSMSEAITKGKHSKNPTTRKRAVLARTFRNM